MIEEYQKIQLPATQDFMNKLAEYGRTHPDLDLILAKYNLKPAGASAGLPAIGAPDSPLPADK